MQLKRSLLVLLLTGSLFSWGCAQQNAVMNKEKPADGFEHFAMADLVDQLKSSERPYLPFLNRSTMRCGVYRLVAGATDGQAPHELDEVYYVLNGRARFRVGEEEVDVKPGDVLFVAAHETHQFLNITEDLELLVFFSTAPPEGK